MNGIIKAKILLLQCLSQFDTEEENVTETLYNIYPDEMIEIEKLIASQAHSKKPVWVSDDEIGVLFSKHFSMGSEQGALMTIKDFYKAIDELKTKLYQNEQSIQKPITDETIEALTKINQMTDCGSPEATIIRMKEIASEALKLK